MNVFIDFRLIARRACLWQRQRQALLQPYLHSPLPFRHLHASPAVLSKKYQRPKNDNIPFQTVHLADPISGRLEEKPLEEILASLDKSTHFVELQTRTPFPVVKVIDKSEAHHKKLRQKAAERELARRNARKEFQFTWGMGEGDLGHKLERAKVELRKGLKVDLVFAPKPKQKAPPLEEMKDRMEGVMGQLQDVGVEWKPREFSRGIAALFLQSTGTNAATESS